jgi:flagellin
MAYSLLTNISSLQAQEYLRQTTNFQQKTINRVSSGLKIVKSGDDAAGLAVANSMRSDRAVLTQGISNANDGLATLQTIDGGINNISNLLDRARTLAAQSASGTFTGDRSVLNSEFASVIDEIDRQAKAIGLDTGGLFAKTLSVFVGGGRAHTGEATSAQITNGSVSVDLSNSTVDAKSLGLKGYQVMGVTGTDIGTGAASTSVEDIVTNTTNLNSVATSGYTDFYVYGAGFAGGDRIKVSVNLSGVTDTDTLVAAINNAIETAGNGTTEAATAFKNASITAAVNTATDGTKQLTFSSSSSAFQVRAGDRMANALMGNYTSSSDATGKSLDATYTAGVVSAAGTETWAANTTIRVRFQGGGMASPVDLTLGAITGSSTTVDTVIADLSSQVANNATLAEAGITMTGVTAGGNLAFTSSKGESFEVLVQGDIDNNLGFGSVNASGSDYFEYTSITGAGAAFTDTESQVVEFIVGGSTASLTLTVDTNLAGSLDAINAALLANSVTRDAGIHAEDSGGQLKFSSTNGTKFRLAAEESSSGTDIWGFGAHVDSTDAYTAGTATVLDYQTTFNSGGAEHTALGTTDDVFRWDNISLGGDDQTITLTANDASGTAHSLSIVLANDASASTGRTLDQALAYINEQLKTSNDPTLNKLVAVKENDINAGADYEGIRFLGPTKFKVTIGTNSQASGINNQAGGSVQGLTTTSETSSGGSVADIGTQANAEAAVTLLADAVSALGTAQAAVGKGQNTFGFATSLAQTQLNNLAASESYIRDADLAAEAANLTKASILQQAGIAALAQANISTQQVLSLLSA